MNRSRLVLLTAIITLLLTAHITTAKTNKTARDFLFIGIDPKTENDARNGEIYLVRSDGSRVTNLTNTPLDSENHAYWSADGRQIFFSRNSVAVYPGSDKEQSSTSFYVMDVSADGKNTGEKLLFRVSDLVGKPMRVEDWAISPDAYSFVFIPSMGAPTYLVTADGSNLREVLPAGTALESPGLPLRWSPNSAEFAFRRQDCKASLSNDCPYWVLRRDDGYKPELIGDENALMKRWQPESTYVTYSLYNFEVHHGDQVIFHSQNVSAALSPDNQQLAYVIPAASGSDNQIVTVNLAEPSTTHDLVHSLTGTIDDLQWSPDGSQLVIMQWSGESYEHTLYSVNADGTYFRELLRRQRWPQYNDGLAWRPDLPSNGG